MENIQNKTLKQIIHRDVRIYFKKNNITKYANSRMYIKMTIIILLWIAPYVSMYFMDYSFLQMLLWGTYMGIATAAVGMNVMHDAAHGALSKRRWVNNIFAEVITLLAGLLANWQKQHNILHHTHTNIEDHDEDISPGGTMRFSRLQKWKSIHQYQHIYAPFMYGIMVIYWFLIKDWVQIYKFQNMKEFAPRSKHERNINWIKLVFVKFIYIHMWIIFPIIFWDMSTFSIICFFLVMHFFCGLILGLIFQLAHIVPKAEMYSSETYGTHTAEHQIATSINFATESRFWTWFTGGLNRQMSHHLLPNVCHIHLPKLDGIIEKACEQKNVAIKEYKTFRSALCAHFTQLKKLGKKPA